MNKRIIILIASLLLFGVLACIAFAGWWHWESEQEKRFDVYIAEASKKYQLEEELIRAVIWRESDFDDRAVGRAKERGLMQVTPMAGQEWAKAEKIASFQPTDLFDPRTNIMAGTWYLSRAIGRWKESDEPIIFGLAEYNAGRSNVLRWVDGLPAFVGVAFMQEVSFPSTKTYIKSIMRQYHFYRSKECENFYRVFKNRVSRRIEFLRNQWSLRKNQT